MLIYLYVIPNNSLLFEIIFTLTNGPLAFAVVMWRNSLVFHDLDKLTSVFIHLFPPLVSFCLRWYPLNENYSSICINSDCSIGFYDGFLYPLILYSIWQAMYTIQTEYIDKKKIEKDKDIMTSARWMSKVKPHPVWVWFHKRGAPEASVHIVLAGTQFIYTMLMLAITIPLFNYFLFHAFYLSIISLICVWNGANFYFEIFTETYSKRLQRYIKQTIKDEKDIAQLQEKQEKIGTNIKENKAN